MSRTHRNPYTKSKRFDASCRGHGGCPWCYRNRMYRHLKRADDQEPRVRIRGFRMRRRYWWREHHDG